MAQCIDGNPETFNAMVFKPVHADTGRFIQQMASQVTERLSDAGRAFMDQTQNVINQLFDSNMVRMATAAARMVSSMAEIDCVRELTTIGQMQNAPTSMVRWIMANPTIRWEYHHQTTEGYGDRYVDAQPGVSGEAHYDYRRVMHGLVVEDEHGGWRATSYLDEDDARDQLSLDQQVDVIRTWDNILHEMKHGNSDPLSRWNSART